MQKIILITLAIVISIFVINNKENQVLIPQEAIRLRIIPNSNQDIDLIYKELIKAETEKQITSIIKNANTLEEARYLLSNKVEGVEAIVEEISKVEEVNQSVEVNYGLNYFPQKEYKGVIYEEGYYESMVITLGEGKGDNWWCVLFPPLCLLEQDQTNKEEAEYRFFIKDIIDNFFS